MTDKHPDYIFFEAQLPNLLREHKNQFVIVKNKAFHGFYSSFEEALQKGYDQFQNMDFLIQEITDEKRFNLSLLS